MNHVVLRGNLTKDPEIKVIETGGKKTSVANFTVAVSRYYKKGNGESAKDTTFVPCEAWDSGAEAIGNHLTKGSGVLVEGSLKSESWEKDGQKHSRLKLRVSSFERIAGAPKDADDAAEPKAETVPAGAGSGDGNGDEGLPF